MEIRFFFKIILALAVCWNGLVILLNKNHSKSNIIFFLAISLIKLS